MSVVKAQPPATTPTPAADEEVLRINAELVQTDVMVFDKQGRFVDNLQPQQFELRINGKPQAISFFERVYAGSVDEDLQLAAARGRIARVAAAPNQASVKPLDRGRTIIFFVDDLHMSPSSMVTARKTMLQFINHELGQNDQAAITSPSGQIGFLQQFTDNKIVLRAAVERLKHRPFSVLDNERPPMTEYMALLVERRDHNVLDFFIDEILRDSPQLGRAVAESMVQSRAHMILRQSNAITFSLLSSLQSLMQSTAQLPGRKIAFLLSDGFLLDTHNSDVTDRMRRITDAAARSGVVVYSLDTRGLSNSSWLDASSQGTFDPSGRILTATSGELSASQESLRILAGDTGGRALLNSNSPETGIKQSLKETSLYYLLAWQPEPSPPNERRKAKFHNIAVSIKDRPDLKVLMRRGFFDVVPPEKKPTKGPTSVAQTSPTPLTPERELFDALTAVFPRTALPTSLSLGYINSPSTGLTLNASMEIERSALKFAPVTEAGTQNAQADLVIMVYNAEGKIVSQFKDRLTVASPAAGASQNSHPVTYSHLIRALPGLYQVRVAARDPQTRQVGSAWEWIEIPDPAKGQFLLSSIFVGESKTQATPETPVKEDTNPVHISVARRFTRDSRMRFLLDIYNAARGPNSPPDLALQIQLFRDNQPVMTTPLRKIRTQDQADLARIPYAAELSLHDFPIGQYVLQINAIDRTAKASAQQRINFSIE